MCVAIWPGSMCTNVWVVSRPCCRDRAATQAVEMGLEPPKQQKAVFLAALLRRSCRRTGTLMGNSNLAVSCCCNLRWSPNVDMGKARCTARFKVYKA